MKRTEREIKKQTEDFLNERWQIVTMVPMADVRPQDLAYYNGAIKACEFLGYEWYRNENGCHTLIKIR